jgi:hypothetical protein
MKIEPQERDEFGVAAAVLVDALLDALVRTNRMSKDDVGNILAQANQSLSKSIANASVRGASRIVREMIADRTPK